MQVATRVHGSAVRADARCAVVRCHHTSKRLVCQAKSEKTVGMPARRDALLAAGGLFLGSQLVFSPSPAMAFDFGGGGKSAQKQEFKELAEAVVSKMITKEDAADANRLALRCVGTYDAVSKSGGFNGAIMTNPDELSRPENARLRPFAEKLRKVKKAVDAEVATAGFGAISYADLMVLAVKTANLDKWGDIKVKAGNRDSIAAYAAPWPVILGRVDSAQVGTTHLPPDDAPVEEIRGALLKLGVDPSAKPGLFPAKPPFWERPGFLLWCAGAIDEEVEEGRFASTGPAYADVKKAYDGSRRTITRTNYEVDFIEYFERMSYMGAKFDKDAYTHA